MEKTAESDSKEIGMHFKDLCAGLHADRLLDLAGKTPMFRWFWNSRRVRETKLVFNTKIVRSDGSRTDIGKVTYHYADQNPMGRSKEARIVAVGRWHRWDVGWLWTVLNGNRVWLAKVSPEGSEDINKGYIDKEDNVHLDLRS